MGLWQFWGVSFFYHIARKQWGTPKEKEIIEEIELT